MKGNPKYGVFGVGDLVKIIQGKCKNKIGEIYSAWSPQSDPWAGNIYYEELDVYAPWWVRIDSILELCTNSQLVLVTKIADMPPSEQIAERNMVEFKAKRFVV